VSSRAECDDVRKEVGKRESRILRPRGPNTLPALVLGLPRRGKQEGQLGLRAIRWRVGDGARKWWEETHVRRRREPARVAVQVMPVRVVATETTSLAGERTTRAPLKVKSNRDGRMTDVGEKDTEATAEPSAFYDGDSKYGGRIYASARDVMIGGARPSEGQKLRWRDAVAREKRSWYRYCIWE